LVFGPRLNLPQALLLITQRIYDQPILKGSDQSSIQVMAHSRRYTHENKNTITAPQNALVGHHCRVQISISIL